MRIIYGYLLKKNNYENSVINVKKLKKVFMHILMLMMKKMQK